MVILCARAIASGCCQDGAGRGNKAKAQLVSLCRTSGHYILTSTVYLSRSASVTCPVSAAAPGGLEKTAHSATGRPFSAGIPTGSAPCCPVLPRVPPARMRPQRGRGALPGVDAPQAASGPDNARATAACMQIRRGAGSGWLLSRGALWPGAGDIRGNTGQHGAESQTSGRPWMLLVLLPTAARSVAQGQRRQDVQVPRYAARADRWQQSSRERVLNLPRLLRQTAGAGAACRGALRA